LYECVPKTLEIAYLSIIEDAETKSSKTAETADDEMKDKFYPGIFLASTPARFVRPV